MVPSLVRWWFSISTLKALRCVRMLPLPPPLSHQLILLLLYCSTSYYCLFRHHHNSRLRPICMHVLVHHATLPPSTVPCIPQSEMFFHWVVCLCSMCSLCELPVMTEKLHCVEIVVCNYHVIQSRIINIRANCLLAGLLQQFGMDDGAHQSHRRQKEEKHIEQSKPVLLL